MQNVKFNHAQGCKWTKSVRYWAREFSLSSLFSLSLIWFYSSTDELAWYNNNNNIHICFRNLCCHSLKQLQLFDISTWLVGFQNKKLLPLIKCHRLLSNLYLTHLFSFSHSFLPRWKNLLHLCFSPKEI